MSSIYLDLISACRKAIEVIYSESGAGVELIDDFRAPCQLEVVILKASHLDITLQLWIVTHFTDEPDQSIQIHGPIDTAQAMAEFSSIVGSNRFDKPLPENTRFLGAATYRDLVESHLLSLAETMRQSILKKLWTGKSPSVGIASKQLLSENAFIWKLAGDMDESSLGRAVGSIHPRPKPTQPATPPPVREPVTTVPQAMGTYIFPHVWIESRPTHSFAHDLNQRMYGWQLAFHDLGEIVASDNREQLSWIATRNGLVAVTTKDRPSAVRVLNSFMALLTLRGTPALALRENELMSLSVDFASHKIGGWSAPMILPRMEPLHDRFVLESWREKSMPVIAKDAIVQTWNDIISLSGNDAALDLLETFGEVYTHFQKGEYPQAVLLAWTMVEMWYQGIRGRVANIDRGLRKRQPEMASILKLLEIDAETNSELASQIYALRALRSEVSHYMRHVTKEEAQLALAMAFGIIRRAQADVDHKSHGPRNTPV